MVTTKREDVTKQCFCDTLKKTPSLGKFLISTYSIFGGWEGNGGGRLLTFSAFRMEVYSRWALIRGWALIRIYLYIFIFKFN